VDGDKTKQTDLFYPRVINLNERSKDYMRKACFIISILLLISCGNSCAVIGRGKKFRPFDENLLTQVTPGKTTASEVTKLFGAPSEIVELSNGNAYVYERSVDKVTGLWLVVLTFGNYDTQYDRIVFFINNDDVVSHYGSSFNTGSASYAMPF
jgi:hypothetical protein